MKLQTAIMRTLVYNNKFVTEAYLTTGQEFYNSIWSPDIINYFEGMDDFIKVYTKRGFSEEAIQRLKKCEVRDVVLTFQRLKK